MFLRGQILPDFSILISQCYTKIVQMLPDVLCSSRDGVPLGPKTADKPAYQNGSIDTSFGPPPAPLDSTFKFYTYGPSKTNSVIFKLSNSKWTASAYYVPVPRRVAFSADRSLINQY